MSNQTSSTQRIYSAIGAVLGWLSIILQLYLIILNRAGGIAETLIQFFSYFTILTNILVAVCFTVLFLKRKDSFFSRPGIIAAVAVYISIVGIVYSLLLRNTWNPQGLQKIVDELLHTIMPALFVIYWLLFVPKHQLKWKHAFGWLIYPLAYLLFILIRGATTGKYPYPFIEVNSIGYYEAMKNCAFVLLVFLCVSFLFIGIGKFKAGANVKLENLPDGRKV